MYTGVAVRQKAEDLTKRRLSSFRDNELRPLWYATETPIPVTVAAAPPFAARQAWTGELAKLCTQLVEPGHVFDGEWSTHWCLVTLDIPKAWAGKEVHLRWDSSCEACVYSLHGEPLQGLTGSSGFEDGAGVRTEFILSRTASSGRSQVMIEIAVNGMFGVNSDNAAKPAPLRALEYRLGGLRVADIAVFDRQAWDLYWDFVVVSDMALHLPKPNVRAAVALDVANTAVNMIDTTDRATWALARAKLADFLEEVNPDTAHDISVVGHAHMDTAWLWPMDETKRKCIRTWASAVRYMDDYPEYRFACSQAQQYDWVRRMAPGLFQRIQAAAKRGQFIPVGGTWVEMDSNVPCGEAMVRQFLFGQSFFQQHFGQRCVEFWNPDVFGYCAQLPQIMAGVGIRYFLTQKLSWNQFNKVPAHTFLWEGLDGSQVLAHFPPGDTYNSMANVEAAVRETRNYKDMDRTRHSMALFGWGDGGGGPTTAMLEQLRRMRNTNGLPRHTPAAPSDFFRALAQDTHRYVTWRGELYFELHRATYTTQCGNKRGNRRAEHDLRAVELLSSLAAMHGAGSAAGSALKRRADRWQYPRDELNELWKMTLTLQFHDILPGTSIHQVFVDSARDYASILQRCAALRCDAAAAMLNLLHRGTKRAATSTSTTTTAPGAASPTRVFNSLAWSRHGVAEVVAHDALHDGTASAAERRYLWVQDLPGIAQANGEDSAPAEARVRVVDGQTVVEISNSHVSAVIDKATGGVKSLLLTDPVTKHQRQAIAAPGPRNRMPSQHPQPTSPFQGNIFMLFDDHPLCWDAWDVDIFHLEKARVLAGPSKVSVSADALRGCVHMEYQLSERSTMHLEVSLAADARQLEFLADVQWNEAKKFLKVQFPVNVRSDVASYEMQYGIVQRPTHMNNSWDMARFEVCGHRWMDLSQPDFGVALLNDCKYGYSCLDNVMRLSLLRAPSDPDRTADIGRHVFRYAVRPHFGSLRDGGVVRAGMEFNTPLICLPDVDASGAFETGSLINISGPGAEDVVLDCVKQAEREADAYVVRLYECHGTVAEVDVDVDKARVTIASITNLLEDPVDADPLNLPCRITLQPMQVVTLLLS